MYIHWDEVEQNKAENLFGPEKVVESQNNFANEDTRHTPNFLQALAELSTEIRSGYASKDMEGIICVQNVFQKHMKNVHYREMLLALERHDLYFYMYAIDVLRCVRYLPKRKAFEI